MDILLERNKLLKQIQEAEKQSRPVTSIEIEFVI